MIRSMILAVALAGAVGCVAQDDETASVEQHTGGALFDCQNKASISGVQCTSIPINVNVNNVGNGNLSDNYLTVLSNDLNDLNIGDINILNGNSILNDVVDVTKNDFLNKFQVSTGYICGVVGILNLTVCKSGDPVH